MKIQVLIINENLNLKMFTTIKTLTFLCHNIIFLLSNQSVKLDRRLI